MSDDRRARLVVWSGFWLLVAAALAFVAAYGRNVPYWDDWRLVPVLAGGEPLSAGWLWSSANMHRYPLGMLLLWGTARLFGGDLRAAMVLSVLLLAGLAALLIRTAAVLRGRASVADVFFPALLLHWGHAHNLLWAADLHFVLAVTVAGVVLCGVARGPEVAARPWCVAAAALLPLQSAIGLAMTPALAIWFAWAARRSGRRALGVAAVAMLALGALSVAAGLRPGVRADAPGVAAALQTTLQFASIAAGRAGRALWPVSGLAIAGALGVTTVLLLRARAWGLLAFLVAAGCVAAAIGVGRAGFGWEAGFAGRYVTLAAPLLVVTYLAWIVHGPRGAPAVLAALVLVALPFDMLEGRAWAARHAAMLSAFEDDARAGVPPAELAERHGEALFPHEHGLVRRIDAMRRAGTGPFAR